MVRVFYTLSFLMLAAILSAQTDSTTVAPSPPPEAEEAQDNAKQEASGNDEAIPTKNDSLPSAETEKPTRRKAAEDMTTSGVSVSPAHFHLKIKPGTVETHSIKVKNDTDVPKSFKVSMYDFDMNGKGKTGFIQAGTGKYSLSKWMNATPNFIELAPGESQKVNITASIPDTEEGYRAAWSIIMVEEEQPRQSIEPAKANDETIAFGITATYAFGVFVYQNPPNVDNQAVEISNFKLMAGDSLQFVSLEAENKGTGIAYCTSYIDLTNLDNGKQQRLFVKRFTIVPELVRDFLFPIPQEMESGKYLAIGVLDFDGADEIQAARLEFYLE